MQLQRRHFEFIAEQLRRNKPGGYDAPDFATYDQWRSVVRSFASGLSTTNGNFDRDRFLRACGVE